MNSRRDVLSGALGLAGTATTLRLVAAQAQDPGAPAPYPRAAADPASKVAPIAGEYTPGDMRRYGLVPNLPGAASSNTRALKALVAPGGTFAGRLLFPNSTGADIYYFDDFIPIRDDVHIDLQGTTLEFSKSAAKTDTNSGFISALRNFSIQNGSIVVKYDMGGIASSAGSAIHIGNRGTDSTHFGPTYDSLLKAPLGNITIRNLRITSNVSKGVAIELTGGLAGVVIENVSIDGQSALNGGIYYEFGWATPGAADLRQTSHARNMRFNNISIANLRPSASVAVTLAGAYNCLIDGLYVSGAAAAFSGTPGESLFYRPWVGADEVGAKRTIALRNIVAQHLTGTALTFAGAQLAANGYLAKRNLDPTAQTDLGDYSLDGFALQGAATGWGIYTSAGKTDIRNGRITGFQRGIVQSDDCTRLLVNAVDVIGCAQFGLQLGLGGAIWNPPRQKMGEIRNCFIAGNGTQSVGTYAAILLDKCAEFVIEGNRIGYEVNHDGVSETSQGNAVQLGSGCTNVVCRSNYVGGMHGGGVAYFNGAVNGARGNTIEWPAGTATTGGPWEGITAKRRLVPFAVSITFDVTGSEQFDLAAMSSADFSINAPVNPVVDKTITITVRNSSGGPLGKTLWNSVFKMSEWTNPANGHNRSLGLRYDGSHWVQIYQTGSDVPN